MCLACPSRCCPKEHDGNSVGPMPLGLIPDAGRHSPGRDTDNPATGAVCFAGHGGWGGLVEGSPRAGVFRVWAHLELRASAVAQCCGPRQGSCRHRLCGGKGSKGGAEEERQVLHGLPGGGACAALRGHGETWSLTLSGLITWQNGTGEDLEWGRLAGSLPQAPIQGGAKGIDGAAGL